MACFYPANSLVVYLKKGSFDGLLPNEHTCQEINERTNTRRHGLTDYTKEAIRTLIGQNVTAPSDIHTELIRLKTLANEEKRISFGDIPAAIQISTFKRTLVPNKVLDQNTLKD